MRVFSSITERISNAMSVVAGIMLAVMLCITMTDVIMRFLGKPIIGVYELVAFLGATVAGFSLPRASLKGAHVSVDLVTVRLSEKTKNVLEMITKCLGFLFFLLGALYLVFMGKNFYLTNTLSMTLKFPYYPVAFGLAAGCLAQSLVLLYQMLSIPGGKHE